MSDMFYIAAAFGLTYTVLAGYALRLRAQRRVLARARRGSGAGRRP